jgi:hypothetical protein
MLDTLKERRPIVGTRPSAADPRNPSATVRRLVIDALGPDELATFARLSNRILEQLDNEPR